MSQHDTLTLRDALRSIQYEAASLADAQVIALQALNATYPARAALSATQPAAGADVLDALEAGKHYAEEALERHDQEYQRHPATEPERSAILADIGAIDAAIAASGRQE